ncbi:MAG: glycosyltransferase family 39 protein [Planctomycetota bacterium]
MTEAALVAAPSTNSGRPPILPLFFFVACFGLFAYHALPLLTFPYELRYGEGVVLDQSRRVFEDPGLYPPFDEPPYLIGNYPPVYPAVCSLLPTPTPFFGGRLLSIVSCLAVAGWIFLLARRYGGDTGGLIAGGLYLVLPEVHDFGVLMRIDSFGLALGLAGFYCTTRESSGRAEMAWRIGGAVAFFFSVYTRHSMLVLPLIAYGTVLGRATAGGTNAVARALLWPLALLVVGASAFLIANVVYNGAPYEHLIFMNRLPYSWSRVESLWFLSMAPWRYPLCLLVLLALRPNLAERGSRTPRDYSKRGLFWLSWVGVAICVYLIAAPHLENLISSEPTLASEGVRDRTVLLGSVVQAVTFLFALGALWGWTGKPEQDRSTRVAGGMVVGGIASALLIGRVGSDVNYLFEYYALGCIAIGGCWSTTQGPIRGLWIGLVAVFVVTNVAHPFTVGANRGERRTAIAKQSRILRHLLEVEDPILSQDPGLIAILDRPLYYQPFMYRQLADAGIWDPETLAKEVREQKFGAIVVKKMQPYAFYEDRNGNRVPQFGPVVESAIDGYPKEVIEAYQQAYEHLEGSTMVEIVTDHLRVARLILVPRE